MELASLFLAALSPSLSHACQETEFGSPCPAEAVPPLNLSVEGFVCEGCEFSLCIDGPADALIAVVVGASDTQTMGLPLPLDLGFAGLAGCDLLVSLDVQRYLVLDAQGQGCLDAAGWTAGIELFFQAFVLGSPAQLVLATSQALAITSTLPPRSPPNVLLIMTDQHTTRAMGCYENGFGGVAESLTPNLDRLASEGVLFERAYCTTPQCAPSRYSILTGRWPHNHGLRWNGIWEPRDQVTLPQLARDMGYVTGTIGKHHMLWLDQPSGQDDDLGFELVVDKQQYNAYCVAEAQQPYNAHGQFWAMPGMPEILAATGFTFNSNTYHPVGYWSDQVIEFLEARGGESGDDRPFLLWYSFYGPHTPVLPTGPADPEDWAHAYHPFEALDLPPNLDKTATTDRLESAQMQFAGVTDAEWREVLSYYYGLTSQIDWNIGRVLDRLDELGLTQDTIVVYTSDHGEMGSEMRCWAKGAGNYEAVTHLPLLVRWPGVLPHGKRVEELVSQIDLFPTLAELTGIHVPLEVRELLDGRTTVGLMLGEQLSDPWREVLFTEFGTTELPFLRQRSAQTTTAKYILDEWSGGSEEFYDLDADPYEIDDRIDAPEVQSTVQELKDELDAWWGGELSHAPSYAVTGVWDKPPSRARFPVPHSGAIDVMLQVDPTWQPSTAADRQLVWMGTSPTTLEAFTELVAMESSFNPGSLEAGTEYFWRVDQVNAWGSTASGVWSFRTAESGAGGPLLATGPTPAHRSAGVALDAVLGWSPGADCEFQSLWFGPLGAVQEVSAGLAADVAAFDPGPLEAGRSYAWRVDGTNADGTTEGTVWLFDTDPTGLPPRATGPGPSHMAAAVGATEPLSWSSDPGPSSFDVYVGTGFPLAYQGSQTAQVYDPGGWMPGETYYWRIDTVNELGTTTGWTWRFTVEHP